ncbi:RNA 2',3'-cyclic phosphodiesterase [Marinobacterium arenosum]|uniref:RNA 2',3'-cyclic phosphodiesterase n=1 Tax=Marinobacterium arenosum TaxID=2862496 RepID=UPI001C978BF6|nr:RNA 2',3'-cyclic phosphodiesterase [Marinobacterium arenosum]MBY4675136.1 RNA 2',3'-cyclic phosphodiesterase [Marinobacterium arenosum]
MRLFVCVDPPGAVTEQIAALLPAGRKIRWNPPDQQHFTLAFLGEQPDNRLVEVIEALTEVPLQRFTLSSKGIGWFRSGVIWLGVETCPELMLLQKRVSDRLQAAGFKMERRSFVPHLTLCRSRHGLDAGLLEMLEHRFYDQQFSFTVDRFLLKRSELRSDGARHITEAVFTAD